MVELCPSPCISWVSLHMLLQSWPRGLTTHGQTPELKDVRMQCAEAPVAWLEHDTGQSGFHSGEFELQGKLPLEMSAGDESC